MTTRSPPQNNAMHLYFRMLADALNDAGFEIKYVLQSQLIERLDALVKRFGDESKSYGDCFDYAADWLENELKGEHDKVDIPWTEESIKEILWRPIQKILVNKESTTELTTGEPGQIYDVLDRHLGEKFGIHVEWPVNKEKP